jgi:hypothetical protein
VGALFFEEGLGGDACARRGAWLGKAHCSVSSAAPLCGCVLDTGNSIRLRG